MAEIKIKLFFSLFITILIKDCFEKNRPKKVHKSEQTPGKYILMFQKK